MIRDLGSGRGGLSEKGGRYTKQRCPEKKVPVAKVKLLIRYEMWTPHCGGNPKNGAGTKEGYKGS